MRSACRPLSLIYLLHACCAMCCVSCRAVSLFLPLLLLPLLSLPFAAPCHAVCYVARLLAPPSMLCCAVLRCFVPLIGRPLDTSHHDTPHLGSV